MRKIVSLFACICITTSQMALADEAWDFDNMAIVESGDVDITAEDIELNDGADTATVSDFDIAGNAFHLHIFGNRGRTASYLTRHGCICSINAPAGSLH